MTRRLSALIGMAALGISLPVGYAALHGQAPASAARPLRHYDEATLSKPTYGVHIDNDVRIRMRDGVSLSVDVYRPDAPGTFPAILQQQLSALRSQPEYRGGPGDRHAHGHGEPDHLSQRALPLTRRAAGDSAVIQR